MSRLLHVFGILCLAGCPGAGAGGDGGPVAVELGTGSLDFEAVDPEQDLELHAGPQGGHHFIVHARASGLVPGDPTQPGQQGNPTTLFRTYDETGIQVDSGFPPYVLGYSDVGGGWYVLPSGRILQLVEGEVARLYGTRVRITVEVEDALGATGSDERWVRVIEGPAFDGDAGVTDDGGP